MEFYPYQNIKTIKRLRFYANTPSNQTDTDIDIPIGTTGKIIEILEGGWFKVVLKIQQTDLSYKTISNSIHSSSIVGLDDTGKEIRKAIEEVYITTVQLAFKVEDGQAPEDFVSEILSDVGLKDWAYLKVGGQYLYPTLRYVPDDHEEGEIFE